MTTKKKAEEEDDEENCGVTGRKNTTPQHLWTPERLTREKMSQRLRKEKEREREEVAWVVRS